MVSITSVSPSNQSLCIVNGKLKLLKNSTLINGFFGKKRRSLKINLKRNEVPVMAIRALRFTELPKTGSRASNRKPISSYKSE